MKKPISPHLSGVKNGVFCIIFAVYTSQGLILPVINLLGWFRGIPFFFLSFYIGWIAFDFAQAMNEKEAKDYVQYKYNRYKE